MSQGLQLLEAFTQFLKVVEYQHTFLKQLNDDPSQWEDANFRKIMAALEINQQCILQSLAEFVAVHDSIQTDIDIHRAAFDAVIVETAPEPKSPKPIPEVLNRLFEQ